MKKNFSRYGVNELGTVAFRVKEKVENFDSPATQPYLSACTNYSQSLARGVISAAENKASDTLRDDTLRGLINVVKGYTYAPEASLAAVAGTALEIIERHGGFSVIRLKYKAETTAIRRIIEELIQLPSEVQSLLQLDYWIPYLTEQNDAFESELSQNLSDQIEFEKTESASLARKELEQTLSSLVDYIELMSTLAPTDEIKQLQSEIAQILDR